MTSFDIIDFKSKKELEKHLEFVTQKIENNNISVNQIPTKTLPVDNP